MTTTRTPQEVVADIRKASRAVYLATDEVVADAISIIMIGAADLIDELEQQLITGAHITTAALEACEQERQLADQLADHLTQHDGLTGDEIAILDAWHTARGTT